MLLAACEKQKGSSAAAGGRGAAEDLAAERAALEDERMALERERLEEERAALEEEKEALRAEREARLAAREQDAADLDASLEERQREIDRREVALADREGDLAARESDLNQQEYVSAGYEPLDDWEPEPMPEAQEPVADYQTFYEDLQPYGSWYETPDYGYVYQPTVVVQDASWRPYTRGRWACTNLGWNWCSDEPFGWACFHYGRWCRLEGRGWVWVPGDEWAPSWVCWREGGDHVGWAPLPPETLCYRNRGWSSSVEEDFGIGWSMFTFVHCRHIAEPLWKHCLPVSENNIYINKTVNITNIHFHKNQIVSGGPRWEKLRRFVGKPWPVYQLQIDRLKAFNQKARERNAVFRGKQLAVFAPNINTKWNANLKPPRIQAKWDKVQVERAEGGIKPEWRERFREARQKQQEQAAAWARGGGDRQKLLQSNRQKVAVAQEKLELKQQELIGNRRGKFAKLRDQERETKGPAVEGNLAGTPQAGDARKEGGGQSLSERQRKNAQRLREQRAQRNGGVDPSRRIADRDGDEGTQEPAADQTPREHTPRGGAAERLSERRRQNREAQANNGNPAVPQRGANESSTPQPEQNGDGTRLDRRERQQDERAARQQQQQADPQQAQEQEISRRERIEEARRQQADEAAQRELRQAREAQEETTRRERMRQAREQQQERARRLQEEQAGQQGEENNRRQRMEEARRQQQDAARERAEQNQRQQEIRERQEQARQRNEENNRRQQQEEMRRQQQEENARRQEAERARQEARERQQQERARQQEERVRQQEEARRQQQEERARQQEEARRQQQEEHARQQEEARRQAEERARQQEEARRQQEEARRQQQEERARQQEEARRQQEEARRQQQEENARQQQERARQEQERSREENEERQRRGRQR